MQDPPGCEIVAQALTEADAAGVPQVNPAFSFNPSMTTFGLYVIQGGDGANNNPTTLRLTNSVANTSVDVPVQVGPGWGVDNTFFLGVTDIAPFDKVEILESVDATDGMLYDNIVAGGAVPEPGSLALLMLGGACGLCRAARFRRG